VINQTSFSSFSAAVSVAVEDKRSFDPNKGLLAVRDNTLNLLRKITLTFGFVLQGHDEDYRMAMTSTNVSSTGGKKITKLLVAVNTANWK